MDMKKGADGRPFLCWMPDGVTSSWPPSFGRELPSWPPALQPPCGPEPPSWPPALRRLAGRSCLLAAGSRRLGAGAAFLAAGFAAALRAGAASGRWLRSRLRAGAAFLAAGFAEEVAIRALTWTRSEADDGRRGLRPRSPIGVDANAVNMS